MKFDDFFHRREETWGLHCFVPLVEIFQLFVSVLLFTKVVSPGSI